jgi:ComF family protein
MATNRAPAFSTPLRRWWRELHRTLWDLVLPPHCPGCGAGGHPGLCPECQGLLGQRPAPWCLRCGEPRGSAAAPCPSDHRFVTGIAWARAPLTYAGTGGALVRRFKLDSDFGAGLLLAKAMARMLAASVQKARWRRAAMVPVPLHRARRRQRGFDQARFLAEQVGRRCDLEVDARALRRLVPTLPQGDPRVTNRSQNVAGAFALARSRGFAGRRVILVDDVITSGATARSCAEILLQAGAVEVGLLTACRA